MTDTPHPIHVHPLQRLARRNRLVVAVRGGAGTGKSSFAASLAEAGQGRLCLFDTERKARLIPGSDGTRFDALEVNAPDELPEFITWALTEGREQRQYGCFALDSFAMYFGRKHAETLRRLRETTGDPLAQPTADQLAADQMLFQEVLRRLCVDSGASVVITDQIPARGREERTENELGRVLPVTLSGLEYFVDVLLELEVRMDGFETVRVGRVVKSNSQAFPLGLEIHNPTFADLLQRQTAFTPMQSGSLVPADGRNGESTAASSNAPGEGRDSAGLYAEVEQIVREAEAARTQAEAQVQAAAQQRVQMTFATLVERAAALGVTRAQLLVAADHYHGVTNPERLTPDQITDLHQRLTDRYGATPTGRQTANAAPSPEDQAPSALGRPASDDPATDSLPDSDTHESPLAKREQPRQSSKADRPQR
ncbi:MAG TPA: hypothetical protein VF510_00555 [Ktedonobacterales bacterium]